MDPATIASAKGSSVARKSRPLGIAASLVAAGLALTACSAQPGAAAVVDGQRISEQSLSESSQALQPFLQTQLAPATMLSSMIQAQVTLEVAANHGFAASAEDAEAYLDSIAEQSNVDAPETFPEGTLEVTRMLMVTEMYTSSEADAEGIQAEITEELADLDVTINPRYGEWDPSSTSGLFIAQTSPDWLIDTSDDDQAVG